jgi:hypothetical protein
MVVDIDNKIYIVCYILNKHINLNIYYMIFVIKDKFLFQFTSFIINGCTMCTKVVS